MGARRCRFLDCSTAWGTTPELGSGLPTPQLFLLLTCASALLSPPPLSLSSPSGPPSCRMPCTVTRLCELCSQRGEELTSAEYLGACFTGISMGTNFADHQHWHPVCRLHTPCSGQARGSDTPCRCLGKGLDPCQAQQSQLVHQPTTTSLAPFDMLDVHTTGCDRCHVQLEASEIVGAFKLSAAGWSKHCCADVHRFPSLAGQHFMSESMSACLVICRCMHALTETVSIMHCIHMILWTLSDDVQAMCLHTLMNVNFTRI